MKEIDIAHAGRAAQEAPSLNYCTHAIGDLRESAEAVRRSAPHSARNLAFAAQLLERAVKFELPDYGELVSLKSLDDSYGELVRLPFPVCALQAPFPPNGPRVAPLVTDGPQKESPSYRRIALAFEPDGAGEVFRVAPFAKAGCLVWPIYHDGTIDRWIAAPVAVFMAYDEWHVIRHDSAEARADVRLNASREFMRAVERQPGNIALDNLTLVEMQPEICAVLRSTMGVQDAQARAMLDVLDELAMTIGFCVTVNASNVRTATLHPSEKLNRKRAASGKVPFFESRVLELDDARTGHGTGVPRDGIEGRAGPRRHLRRGHLRRIDRVTDDGALVRKVVWVRAAVVGLAARGEIDKTYRVAGAQP